MNFRQNWFLSSVLIFALTTAAFCNNAATGEVETLRKTGQVFADIAEQVTPAVVFVSVEQEVVQQGYNGFGFSDPFGEFNDEFFKRFFGDRFNQRQRRQRQQQPKKQVKRGQGSGFIITPDGYILTNNHVVENADKITVKLTDEKEYDAKVIGTDPETDVAVIKIDANDLPFVELGDSDALKVGQWVIAIGNPFGLSHTVTAGIVSAKGRSKIGLSEYEDFIQTDAAINFGNSGGPLLDIDGKVIGINSAIFSRSGGYMGIGFAIPINMAKYVYDQLVSDGKVTRGYLGIYGKDADEEMAELLGAEGYKGIVVDNVVDDSPASKAKIQKGDLLVKLNGNDISDWNSFRNEIAQIAPGTEIVLTVIRDGKEKDLDVVLEPRESETVSEKEQQQQEDATGLTVETLTDEIAEQLGIEDIKYGVVITAVESYSPAADAGLSKGMVITEVNRKKIEDISDFNKQIKKAENSILLYVHQGKYSRYVVVRIKD